MIPKEIKLPCPPDIHLLNVESALRQLGKAEDKLGVVLPGVRMALEQGRDIAVTFDEYFAKQETKKKMTRQEHKDNLERMIREAKKALDDYDGGDVVWERTLKENLATLRVSLVCAGYVPYIT